MRFQAGRAGQVDPQDIFELAIRAGAARFGRAEQRDERFAERGGHVHRAGVVGDHQIAEPHPLDHFRQGSLRRTNSGNVPVSASRNDFAERFVFLAAQNGETRVGKFFGQQPDQFGKIFNRPAFVLPARAGLERQSKRAIAEFSPF